MNKSNRRKMIISFLVEHTGKVGAPGSVLLIAILWVFYESAEGILVKTPTNTTVIVNQSTFFNCSKSGNKSEQLTWHHYTVDGKAEGVYETGSIRGAYKGRFDIDINITSGTFNLLVQRPEPSDAGRYVCLEDPLEKDPGASAELTILDSGLVCDANMVLHEVIGSTQCDKAIHSDVPLLSCSVIYSGNIAPQMKWRNDEMASESLKTECSTAGNRVMCNTTLNANLIKDGYVFVCQLATARKYNCSLKVKKTIYTISDNSVRNITLMEEASCSANTSEGLPCSYKWYKGNQTEKLGQKLKTNKSGMYKCEAKCIIRNETCAFTAKQINVLESVGNEVSSRFSLVDVILAVTLSITGLCLVVVGAAVLWRKFRKTDGEELVSARPQPIEESLELLLNQHDGSDDAIGKVFNNNTYISRGFSGGHIHGPMQYRNEQCICERIKHTNDEQTQTNEVEMTETDQMLSNCRRWMALDHTNLIKFYDVIVKSQDIFIMMEYAAGGSVRNAIKKCAKSDVILEMPVIKDWATQIAQGMEYLHENNFVHQNLDSVRILIMESFEASNITNKTLKIVHFCLIDVKVTGTQAQEKFSFTAPEVFDGTHDKQSDAWSFGIVIWEMLTGRIPYKDEKALGKILQDIRHGATVLTIPNSCPKALKEILKGCRSLNPSERPSFAEISESLQAWENGAKWRLGE